MTDILINIGVCLIVAVFLMIFHELCKGMVYLLFGRKNNSGKLTLWKVWKYIDPIGILLGVVCYVPISKPYFFRIRDQRTNRLLGIAGLLSMVVVFSGSIFAVKYFYGGMEGLKRLVIHHWYEQIPPLLLQYMALLSFGMLVANLFPVSTFDMGLLVAGVSAASYLKIIKADSTVKIIFVLTLLLELIQYAGLRVLDLLL